MVMDAQPSPQSVGREFVRQYYTLLNKAPSHLHRFYNNHSSFIHGGLDSNNREATLVIGQKDIHNKIQQLNFRDCHAKISQVDAQATLGNGVVVQVTGELSNDGQPMRRFTQTFVLAAQSPKNYYVHNDIFRYQDLYSDDENDGETRSENDDEQDTEQKHVVENSNISTNNNANQNANIGQPQIYYSIAHPAATAPVVPHPAVNQTMPTMQPFTTATVAVQQQQQQQVAQVNGVHDELMQGVQQSQQPQQQQQQQTVAQVPVISSPVSVITAQQSTQAQPQQQSNIVTAVPNIPTPTSTAHQNLPNTTPVQEASAIASVVSSGKQENSGLDVSLNTSTSSNDTLTNTVESTTKQEIDTKKDDFKVSEPTEKLESNKIIQNEPKTYANLLKSMSNTTNSTNSGFMPLQSSNTIKSDNLRSDGYQQNNNSNSLSQRSNSNRKDFSERRTSNTNSHLGDSLQLFLGNIPHHATEEELTILFSKYGKVIDLRIHSKQTSKVPGIRLPPNYGFITYEDQESIQNCLASCPIFFPDQSGGQKLNVEEKKMRPRNPNEMSRLSNNMSNSGNSGNVSRSGSNSGNRSLSNTGSGGMMRGGAGNNGPGNRNSSRQSGSGGFGRNDSRGPPGNRGGNNSGNNLSSGTGGNNTYGRR